MRHIDIFMVVVPLIWFSAMHASVFGVSSMDATGKKCPNCGSSDTEERGSLLLKLFRRYWPFSTHRKFRCHNCGYEWKYWFD